MQSAIVDWFGYSLSARDRMRLIARAGFASVLLLWSDQFDSDYLEFPEYARAEGLSVENAHAPYLDANALWLDTLEGDALAEQLLLCLAQCAQRGVPTLVVHPANGRFPLPQTERGIARVQKIADQADALGVNLSFENMENPSFLDLIFSQVHSKRLGFCYDSGHRNVYTPEQDILRKHGRFLQTLHLHDNDGRADSHSLPFSGTVDWEDFAAALAATPYSGALGLEVRNTGFESIRDPLEFLTLANDRARSLGARIDALRAEASPSSYRSRA